MLYSMLGAHYLICSSEVGNIVVFLRLLKMLRKLTEMHSEDSRPTLTLDFLLHLQAALQSHTL